MRTLLQILFLLVLAACKSPSNDKTVDNFQKDTLQINDLQFIQILKDSNFNCLTSLKGDTIIKSENYYFKTDFIDIDEDGYKDIRVFVFSNSPNQCDNYLFDKDNKTFRQIKNCDLDIQKIKDTKYFYSYNRTGCADMNWESYLCVIDNWTEIHIGFMNVKGCGDKDDGIYIYKILGSDKKLIQTILIKTFDNNGSDNKWDFIKEYWTKNYKTFE